jgi:hypothetical protein
MMSPRVESSVELEALRPLLAGLAIAEDRLFDRVEQFLFAESLVKNSTAPAFIARTLIGISPCPVRKMIGVSMPDFASSVCIKHAGTSGRWPWANSVADPNVCTVKPAELRKSATESRTNRSSSMTNTMRFRIAHAFVAAGRTK